MSESRLALNVPRAELRQLFAEWLDCELAIEIESSRRPEFFAENLGRVVSAAKERAARLGLDWDDDFVPETVRSVISPPAPVEPKCQACGGTGYLLVAGYGIDSSVPCPLACCPGPAVPAEPMTTRR